MNHSFEPVVWNDSVPDDFVITNSEINDNIPMKMRQKHMAE